MQLHGECGRKTRLGWTGREDELGLHRLNLVCLWTWTWKYPRGKENMSWELEREVWAREQFGSCTLMGGSWRYGGVNMCLGERREKIRRLRKYGLEESRPPPLLLHPPELGVPTYHSGLRGSHSLGERQILRMRVPVLLWNISSSSSP